MASLTGNKIKDTYSSLLKVGDNGAIDSSAQALSDGAGNAVGLTLTNTGVIVSDTSGTLIGTSSTNVISNGMMADDAIGAAEIVDNSVGAAELNVSGNGSAGEVLTSDGDGSFSWGAATSGDITGVTAGTGLSGGGTSGTVTVSLTAHTGDVTGTTALTIANDVVTAAKLADEFTAAQAVTSAAAITLDGGAYDVFTWTSGHSTTLAFTNITLGMTKSIIITGSGGSNTVAFGNINGSSGTFNLISGTYSDAAVKNLIQLKFISTSECWYTISQISS